MSDKERELVEYFIKIVEETPSLHEKWINPPIKITTWKHLLEQDKEIERLNNIIKEVREYILGNDLDNFDNINNLLNILKGYLEQKGTPTPDKPVEIKSKLIGKNLFETYEVNGKQYTDNIPKDTLICISKEEFIEYKQQKEEIERLNNIINDLLKRQNEALNYISNFLSMDNRYKHGNGNDELELVRRILNKHNQELKGSDKE